MFRLAAWSFVCLTNGFLGVCPFSFYLRLIKDMSSHFRNVQLLSKCDQFDMNDMMITVQE